MTTTDAYDAAIAAADDAYDAAMEAAAIWARVSRDAAYVAADAAYAAAQAAAINTANGDLI